MKHLIRGFISDAREVANTLRAAARVSDTDHMRLICRQLKGAGGGYGFDDVSRSAYDVIEALDNAAGDVEAQQTTVNELLEVLGRIRVCG